MAGGIYSLSGQTVALYRAQVVSCHRNQRAQGSASHPKLGSLKHSAQYHPFVSSKFKLQCFLDFSAVSFYFQHFQPKEQLQQFLKKAQSSVRQHGIASPQITISELLTHWLFVVTLQKILPSTGEVQISNVITCIHQYLIRIFWPDWNTKSQIYCNYRNFIIMLFSSPEMFSGLPNSRIKWNLGFFFLSFCNHVVLRCHILAMVFTVRNHPSKCISFVFIWFVSSKLRNDFSVFRAGKALFSTSYKCHTHPVLFSVVHR